MNKLYKLKEYYESIKHPVWNDIEWKRKIEDVFKEKNILWEHLTEEEAIIRNLEKCYTRQVGIRAEKILNDDERLEWFNKRVNERLEWYKNLKI